MSGWVARNAVQKMGCFEVRRFSLAKDFEQVVLLN